jgi:hypothetical protein
VASIVRRTRKDGTPSYHVKYRAGHGRIRWEHVAGNKKAAESRRRKIQDELDATEADPGPTPTQDAFETEGRRGVDGSMLVGYGAWRSLVSALVWGTRGPRFKSGRPD